MSGVLDSAVRVRSYAKYDVGSLPRFFPRDIQAFCTLWNTGPTKITRQWHASLLKEPLISLTVRYCYAITRLIRPCTWCHIELHLFWTCFKRSTSGTA